MTPGSRRRNQSGFALLLVFLMAAILAISLYKEIPRVAFDTQRQKEELLVERGEQYKRALQVYVRDVKRYPAKIEDLENTNNRHYLRRRYIDPMTGKDEWRIIHIQNGVLTDSKLQKKDAHAEDTATAVGQSVGQLASALDSTNPTQAAAANLAGRRRASDGGTGAATDGTDPNNPGATPLPGMPPVYAPGLPGSTDAGNGQPPATAGQTPTSQTPQTFPGAPGIPGLPGLVQPGQQQSAQPGVPGQSGGLQQFLNPGVQGQSGIPIPGSTGTAASGGSYPGGSSSPVPGFAPGNAQGGFQQPGMAAPGAAPNLQQSGMMPPGGLQQQQPVSGANLANMLNLTGPRPGAMNMTNTNGMPAMSNGIAGFASKGEGESIMIYNDQKDYSLWEFVFDPTKVKPLPNPVTGAPGAQAGGQIGTPATQLGSPAGQQPGSNSSFGNTGAFGSSGGFGSGTGGNTASPTGQFGSSPPSSSPPPPE